MRKQTLLILTTLFLTVAFCGVVSAADGDVIYVDVNGDDGNTGYTPDQAKQTIKNGIDSVNANGVVNIADGIYTGVGNTEITINKSMNINGQSQTGTIIDAENNTWIFRIAPSITVTISQLTLTNGNIDGYGGAIYNEGQLTCNNCQFRDNKAYSNKYEGDGGAIYNEEGEVTCTNCQFTANEATWYGGAICSYGVLTCTNCQFTNNYADDDGGAIFKGDEDSALTCTDCQFTNNYADDDGGAIYNEEGEVTCTNCQFTDNYADDDGGAIYNYGEVTCTNCHFTQNGAYWYGGAIYNYKSVMTCTDCQFTGNYADDSYGGAIYNDEDCEVTCINCQFTGNEADYGGAIYNYYESKMTCTNCHFTQNGAYWYGGAIYNDDSEVTCTNCQFTDNEADYDGGAIYNSGDLTVIGSNLENNKAGNDGGALYNEGEFTLNFNRIIGNTADGDGQDIYNDNTDPDDTHDALYNWWGSNACPAAGRIVNTDGLVEYDPWLVMRYNANPTTITQGETSTLTADFRYDSDGTFHDPADGHLPDGTPVTFTTNLGNVGSKSVVKYTLNGVATAILRGDEAAGAALTSATLDNQTLYSTVTIKARTVEAATTQSTTIGMQKTGAPLAGIVLALLMVLGGFISTRKKQ